MFTFVQEDLQVGTTPADKPSNLVLGLVFDLRELGRDGQGAEVRQRRQDEHSEEESAVAIERLQELQELQRGITLLLHRRCTSQRESGHGVDARALPQRAQSCGRAIA